MCAARWRHDSEQCRISEVQRNLDDWILAEIVDVLCCWSSQHRIRHDRCRSIRCFDDVSFRHPELCHDEWTSGRNPLVRVEHNSAAVGGENGGDILQREIAHDSCSSVESERARIYRTLRRTSELLPQRSHAKSDTPSNVASSVRNGQISAVCVLR